MTKPWRSLFIAALFLATPLTSAWAEVEQYQLDPGHSFVTFQIQHLGYSLMMGRFNQLEGKFSSDASNPASSAIEVSIETASIDTNHAERDKHLRSADFLDVNTYPKAEFKSTKISAKDGKMVVEGQLTLHGVTKPVTFEAKMIGAGKDPWGGYRQGYAATLAIKRSDFGISYNLGPAAETMELGLFIEGIRQ